MLKNKTQFCKFSKFSFFFFFFFFREEFVEKLFFFFFFFFFTIIIYTRKGKTGQSASAIEYANCISIKVCLTHPTPTQWVSEEMTLNHLVVRLQSLSFG